ncbi:hypothetical protein J7T55_015404 [Diaporthe amygdali]|uniref:uncharacterized protein n=1 Tax=Phomopsis amygdali TaxID=1214568 RepID=UPI0022FF1026|nr:uncharacterized protein J7T55_015404 [Diaporthe amygdali]KAJ0120673.1 hypothetical protein J7T55_015404 [Diaporthe amygdali]
MSPHGMPLLRRACDRCHSQKLSCQRHDNGSCERCVKANTTCTSSPSQRNRGARSQSSSTTSLRANNRRNGHASVGKPGRALSMLNTEIERAGGDIRLPDAVANNNNNNNNNNNGDSSFDDAMRELMSTPAVERGPGLHHFQDVGADMDSGSAAETLDNSQMDGIVSHDSGRDESVDVDWNMSTASAFSISDFDFQSSLGLGLLQTSPTTPESLHASPNLNNTDQNRYCILQSLSGTVTPATTTTIAVSGGSSSSKVAGFFDNYPSRNMRGLTTTSTSKSQRQSPSRSQSQRQEQQSQHRPRTTTQTDGQWLQKLVEINVRLFNHANQVTNQTASTATTNATASSDGQSPATPNDFDETVVLSMLFLQALRNLHSTSSIRELPTAHITAALSKTPPVLDPGTTLIICSCYIRVLELFIERLHAIRDTLLCGGRSSPVGVPTPAATDGAASASPAPPLPLLALPTLAACSCPMDDYPVLKVRMTLVLVEEILDVMSALMLPIIRGPSSTSPASGGGLWEKEEEEEERRRAMPWRSSGAAILSQPSQVPQVSLQALSTREEAAYQIIRDIRRDLKTSRRFVV